jgi:hypothetical protein
MIINLISLTKSTENRAQVNKNKGVKDVNDHFPYPVKGGYKIKDDNVNIDSKNNKDDIQTPAIPADNYPKTIRLYGIALTEKCIFAMLVRLK